MKKFLPVTLIMISTLAACGGQSDEEKTEKFRTSFIQSCVSEAQAAGVTEEVSQTICGCSADKVIEQMGPTVVNVPAPLVDKILDQCADEAGVKLGG